MRKLFSTVFLMSVSNVLFASDINVSIKSYDDYVAYMKVVISLSETKQCSGDKKLILENGFKKLNINDDLLILKYKDLNKYDCSVLESISSMLISNKLAIIKKYPAPDFVNLNILSVDKNTAAHNVMVGDAKKGSWIICYGLNAQNIPLAKQTSLVKSKYTVVNISSKKYHNEIVKYECELEA